MAQKTRRSMPSNGPLSRLPPSPRRCADAQQPRKPRSIGLAVANLQADFFNQIKQSVEPRPRRRASRSSSSTPRAMRPPRSTRSRTSHPERRRAHLHPGRRHGRRRADQGRPRRPASRSSTSTATPTDAPGDTFIATDSVAAAKAVGEYVVKQAGGKGEIAIIQGQNGTTPEVDRTRAAARRWPRTPASRSWPSSPPTGTRTRASSSPRTCCRRTPTSRSSSARPTRWRSAPPRPSRSPISATRCTIAGFDGDVAGLKAVAGRHLRRHRDPADPEHGPAGRRSRRSS